ECLAGEYVERHAIDGARDTVNCKEVSLDITDGEQGLVHIRLASRGSSRSRRPSPRRFTPSTTSASAMPGAKMVQGARARNRRLCAIMLPQVGISGGVPAPRKESAASIRIAEAQMYVACTIRGAIVWGSMCQMRIFQVVVPRPIAA